MQAKKTNPEKTKNPEMLTLDSTYRIGNRSFIVEPVFKEESSQTLGEVLLRHYNSNPNAPRYIFVNGLFGIICKR